MEIIFQYNAITNFTFIVSLRLSHIFFLLNAFSFLFSFIPENPVIMFFKMYNRCVFFSYNSYMKVNFNCRCEFIFLKYFTLKHKMDSTHKNMQFHLNWVLFTGADVIILNSIILMY